MSHVATHIPPLGDVDWLNDPWDLVHKRDCSSDVIEHSNVANLFPRHRHVFHQLQHGVRHVLQRTAQPTITNYSQSEKRDTKNAS